MEFIQILCYFCHLHCHCQTYLSDSCVKVGKQATNKEEVGSIHWGTFTGVLGSEVNGIWEKYTDTNDVNALDSNFGGEVAVTGDDFGLVKLFRFPCLKKGECLHMTCFYHATVTVRNTQMFSVTHARLCCFTP